MSMRDFEARIKADIASRINRIIAVARGEIESHWWGDIDDEGGYLDGIWEVYQEFQPKRAEVALRFFAQARPLLAGIPGVDLQVEPDFDTSDVELVKLASDPCGVWSIADLPELGKVIDDFVYNLVHFPKPYDGRWME